jgi:hypothetical protein
MPTDTLRTVVPRLEALTGTGEFVESPFPNWPFELDPQHHRAPEVLMTHVWRSPEVIDVVASAMSYTDTGRLELLHELFPN